MSILKLLSARRAMAAGIFLTIFVTGVIVTLIIPPTYQSTIKILITRDRIDPRVTAADRSIEPGRGELTDEDFNSELEILQSRTVLEGAARSLGLDKNRERQGSWHSTISAVFQSLHKRTMPDPIERAVADLADRLEAVSIRNSRILKVTYRDYSPERAAQILNEIYRQYSDHHLRLHQTSKAPRVFREQSAAFMHKLNLATDELKRFDAANGGSANETQRTLLLQQFYQIQGQLDQTGAEIAETVERATALREQLKSQPERIEAEAKTIYASARDRIKDEILTQEIQLTQLRQKYQPGHRLVKEVEERLEKARELLAREENAPPQELTTVPNELRRRLTGDLIGAESSLPTLHKRESRLAALAAKYRERITRFDARILERLDLERARAVNEEAYLLFRKKAQEADIVDALNQEKIVNVSLVEAANIDHQPVSPNPLINLALLLVTGLVTSIGTVLLSGRERSALPAIPPAIPGLDQPQKLIDSFDQ